MKFYFESQNSMNYIVLYHVGLGDHIIMNGYIHYLRMRDDTKKICILAYDNYSKNTLTDLYSDYPMISFYYFINDSDPIFSMINRRPWMSTCIYDNEIYHILTFGCHSEHQTIYYGDHLWNSSFYIHAGVHPSIQFSHFTLPYNMNNSKEKYKELVNILQTDKYIIIHDDPSRNIHINENIVNDILIKNNHQNLSTIYLGINRYQYPLLSGLNNVRNVEHILTCHSLLDYYDIISNATECHFIDSSTVCLTDRIIESSSSLYLHYYSRNSKISNKIMFEVNRKWNLLS